MFSRHRLMAKFIAAMLVTLAATTAAPQQSTPSPVYNIELIVFRVGGGASAEAAGGTSLRVPLGGGDAGEASAAAQVGRFVGSIPAAQFQLGEIEAKLRSSQYTPNNRLPPTNPATQTAQNVANARPRTRGLLR